MSNNDAQLIKRAKQGDPEAFTLLYEKHYSAIYSYVYYRVYETGLAEDLTSEVFVRLVSKIDLFKEQGRPLLAWLYTIAGNLVRDHHRKASRATWVELDDRHADGRADPSHNIDSIFTQERLAKAIRVLTDEQAQVIVFKFVKGLSNAEVAEIMNKNVGSVKSLQHRALRSLQRILEAEQLET